MSIDTVSSVSKVAMDVAEQSSKGMDEAAAEFENAFANASGDTLGESVVQQMGDLRESYNTKVEAINQSAAEMTTPAEMLQLQWQVSSLTLQQDLLAKTAGKSNQNLETLLKMQ